MKRLLSVILAVLLIVSALPTFVFAEGGDTSLTVWDGTAASGFESGIGTEDDPYIIKTAEQLAFFAKSVNSGNLYADEYVKLESDILLNDVSSFENWKSQPPKNTWEPIGKVETTASFMGYFDGNGHTISGMYLKSYSYDKVGLFRYVSGEITNLGVINSYVYTIYRGNPYAGGIAAKATDAAFRNCYYEGVVLGSSSDSLVEGAEMKAYAGGIVGYANSTVFEDCYSNAEVDAVAFVTSKNASGYTYAGGIVGYSDPMPAIRYCYSTGTVESNCTANGSTSKSAYAYSGGIVGYSPSTHLSDCFNRGTVKARASSSTKYQAIANSGGIVGGTMGGSMSNCYNANLIEAYSNVTNDTTTNMLARSYTGGIVGYTSKNTLRVTDSYNVGGFKGSSNAQTVAGTYVAKAIYYCGGIVGYADASRPKDIVTFDFCYYRSAVNVGIGNAPLGTDDAYRCDSAQMMKKETYGGFDFTNDWGFTGSKEYLYPELRHFMKFNKYVLKDGHAYYYGDDGSVSSDGKFPLSPQGYLNINDAFLKIEDDTYYFINDIVVTGYRVARDRIYYFGTDGKMSTNSDYEFGSSGYIVAPDGFITVDGNTYYMTDNKVTKGYIADGGKVYYFGADGKQTTDGIHEFSSEGYILGDKILIDNTYYIINNTIATGYHIIDRHIYYFGSDGKPAYDGINDFTDQGYIAGYDTFVTINGDTYFLVTNCVISGYRAIEGKVYYFGEDGKMTTDGKYEFSSDGYILGDSIFVNDTFYLVDNTAVTGYRVIDDRIYHFKLSGIKGEDGVNTFSPEGYITGNELLLELEEAKYYLVNDKIFKGYQAIEGRVYYFGEDGVLTTNEDYRFSTKKYVLGDQMLVADKYFIIDSTVITTNYITDSKIYFVDSNGLLLRTVDLVVDFLEKQYVYTGSEIKPTVVIEELEGSDFTVEFENNINAGISSAIITGVGNFAGGATVNFTINKAPVATPDAPVIKEAVNDTVILEQKEGCEYKYDDGEWQDGAVFYGLMLNKEYTFYCRVKETENTLASDSAVLPIKTKIVEPGDINDDGVVDVTDLALLKLHLANMPVGEVFLTTTADINIDREIDTVDLSELKLKLAGA